MTGRNVNTEHEYHNLVVLLLAAGGKQTHWRGGEAAAIFAVVFDYFAFLASVEGSDQPASIIHGLLGKENLHKAS